MRIVIGIIVLMLLFGCNGEDGPLPEENITNVTNVTEEEPPPVTIIIGEQENQTVEANLTEEEEEVENVTEGIDYEYDPDQPLGLYFIYVGDTALHGDAILIKKGDMDVLVDAGPQQKSGEVIDFLRSRGVDDIEVLISTNGDPRHYGGIKAVADAFGIEELWWGGNDFGDAQYLDTINKVKSEAKSTQVVEDGYTADLNGMDFEVLNPPAVDKFDDVNNDAIVTRIKDRNFSILLTSGIQTGAQGRLINQRTSEIKNPVIQAPYYGVGAGTGNIGIFLVTAKPEVMILSGSADDSPENGGSREPFERLMDQYGIEWRKNYEEGTLRITSDGTSYDIQALSN
jgi:competence protein ComEC